MFPRNIYRILRRLCPAVPDLILFSNVHKQKRKAGQAYGVQHPAFAIGHRINCTTGVYEQCDASVMADFHFYEVNRGDVVRLGAGLADIVYQLAFYSGSIDGRLIHSYCYSDEESWASFTRNIRPAVWRDTDMQIRRHGWIRLIAKKADGTPLGEDERCAAQDGTAILRRNVPHRQRRCFKRELEKTARTVASLRDGDTLVYAVLTDIHYVINGGWEDTACNIRALHERVHLDGIICLGDLTDGMVPLAITKEYALAVLSDLKGLGCPVWVTLGNHDANYFRNNPEPLDLREQSLLYAGRDCPYYFVDSEEKRLRMLFLCSFDHTQTGQNKRYGFPAEELEWVRSVLGQTPHTYKVLVFAHVPLLASMHYWSDEIRNGPELAQILEDYAGSGGTILAYIHGHTHSDQMNVDNQSFPVVSIGCAKVEDDQKMKCPGSTTYRRRMGGVTQELWDVLAVNARTGTLDFVRFGAGKDREITNNGRQ